MPRFSIFRLCYMFVPCVTSTLTYEVRRHISTWNFDFWRTVVHRCNNLQTTSKLIDSLLALHSPTCTYEVQVLQYRFLRTAKEFVETRTPATIFISSFLVLKLRPQSWALNLTSESKVFILSIQSQTGPLDVLQFFFSYSVRILMRELYCSGEGETWALEVTLPFLF